MIHYSYTPKHSIHWSFRILPSATGHWPPAATRPRRYLPVGRRAPRDEQNEQVDVELSRSNMMSIIQYCDGVNN